MIPRSLLAALNPTAGQIQPPTQAYQGVNNAVGYGNDLGMLEDQQRKMAELQAQGAMIQPNMPTMPTMGKEEKGLLQLAKLFAIGSGVDPRQIAQEEQNYNQRRQQEIQLAHQNATQMALAQANQQMGANKADQYRLGAEGQITEGRVKRRESDMAAKAQAEQAELAYQRGEASKAADRTSREKIAEMRTPGEKIEDLMLRFGLNQADATEMLAVIDAKQTAAKRGLLGAQTGDLQSKTKERDTLLPERVNLIKSQVGVNDERAKKLAVETELLPEATAIAYSRLDLAWQQFAENARQFNTQEGRLAGQAAQAQVNKSLTEFNAEVKTFEGEVRKAQEAAMAALGMTEWPAQTPEAATAFAGEIARRYAAAQAIVKKNDPADPNLPRAQAQVAAIEKLWRQRSGLQQAYDKRRKIKEEMETSGGEQPGPKAPAPSRGNSLAKSLRSWGDGLFGGAKIEQFSGTPRMTRGSSRSGGKASKHNHGHALDVYHRSGAEREANIQKAMQGGATLIIDYQGQRTWRPGRGWRPDKSLSKGYSHVHVENDKLK